MGKVPLPVLKELEHQARQNLSTINFIAAFAKTFSSCNSTLEKYQHSMKSSFKKVKTQIQKGANPEKAARRGYKEACEYSEIWNETILIQQRVLACLSKYLAHILQRELYTMGNTGLLRRKAEMTLLQTTFRVYETPRTHLPFWPSLLFKSQLVKEGEDFLLKKVPLKMLFRCPHNKKRGSYKKRPYGGNSSQSSNQSFTSGGGNQISEAPRVVFDPTLRDEGMKTPPPNDSSKASLSPPVGGRLCSFKETGKQTNVQTTRLNIITNGYILHSLQN